MVLVLVVSVALAAFVAVVVGIVLIRRALSRKAESRGYASIGDYLRAIPRTDEEKQDAVDLTLKGLVLCLLGLLVPPLLLIGVLPLFYGTRKLVSSSMGLGLVDDADPSS